MNPRNHGSHFEKHKAAFEEGAGRDDAMMEDVEETSSPISPIEKEKAEVIYKA
jgi:SHS family lactate transporter-like MFS transporter